MSTRTHSLYADEGGACVEVAAHTAAVHVRDSKNLDGPMLTVAPTSWAAFTGHVGR